MYKKVNVKKDDQVLVISGKDKGKKGKVLVVSPKEGKVIVEGVNTITKHAKASQSNPQGGIIHQEAPIDASNVMYVVDGKVTRIGFKTVDDKKVRFAKTTGEVIK